MVHTYLEPRPHKPLFSNLLQLLGKCPYKGPECEEAASEDLLTTEYLLDVVQASKEELKEELSQIMAIEINGIV